MNIKKLFPEKKLTKKGLLEFLDKKGFYIVLVLCVAIVGATAVFVTTHNITSPNIDYNEQKLIPEEANNNITNPDEQSKPEAQSSINTSAGTSALVSSPSKTAAPGKSDTTSSSTAALNSDKKNAVSSSTPAPTKKTASNKTQKFIMPVFGEITKVFANDKLVYSKTLDEWRTHNGTDIASDRGTIVKAVADGVVTEIKNDPRYGITIFIDHQNGIKTVYANLASDDSVSPNQIVKQGDIIGSIGNTAGFECAEQSHLHFEVLKNDECVNPADYLPDTSKK